MPMNTVLNRTMDFFNKAQPFALATVVHTWGSAPRPAGAMMLVGENKEIAGSVSGGCVENAVIEEALQVMQTGEPRLLEFGVSDETAWSVGLACGGKIKVFVEKVTGDAAGLWEEILKAWQQNRPCLLVKDLSTSASRRGDFLIFPDGRQMGSPGKIGPEMREAAEHFFNIRKSGLQEVEGKPFFFQLFPARSRLLIIGAAHIAVPLVKFARALDFEIILIDPRRIFADSQRFPDAPDRILPRWPAEALKNLEINEDTYAVLLSHDPKIDDGALHILLRSNAAYIGALGSRKTHAKRCDRLKKDGFSEAEISRIHGPVGLDIRAATPEEIALSIMAEIVKTKNRPPADEISSE